MAAPTIEQVRDYLRYDTVDDDPALAIILAAGKEWVEDYTEFDIGAAEDVPAVIVLAICLFCAMSDEDRSTQAGDGWKAIKRLLFKHRKAPIA